jgi:HEAT repeat protein
MTKSSKSRTGDGHPKPGAAEGGMAKAQRADRGLQERVFGLFELRTAIGIPAEDAFSTVIEGLQQSDPYTRQAAAHALALLRWTLFSFWTRTRVPQLVELLGDRAILVRFAAATALGRIGPFASPAVPKLIELLGDRAIRVRLAVVESLGRIGLPAAEAMVPRLAELLGDADTRVRWTAVKSLVKFGREGAPAIPQLTEALGDREAPIRSAAAYALGNIGAAAAPAVPRLTKLLEDSDSFVRESTGDALGSIGQPASAPALLAALKTETNESVRREFCRALGKITAAARALVELVVPALAEVADSDLSEAVQITAILALENARPRGRGLSRSLIEQSDLMVAPKKHRQRRPKRLNAEVLKSRLALLETCLAWPSEKVSERAVHKSSLLKTERIRLGLPEKVSAGTVHYHLQNLARMCKVDRLWDLAGNYQFSTFRTGVRERLRRVRTVLQQEIAEEEKAAQGRLTLDGGTSRLSPM